MFNTWDLNITEAATDFVSTSDTGVLGPRQADGSLPNVDYLKLKAGSPLIDKGTDVMLPFVGGAPDLGADEFGAVKAPVGGSSSVAGNTGNDTGGRPTTTGGAGAGGSTNNGTGGSGTTTGGAGPGTTGGTTTGAGASSMGASTSSTGAGTSSATAGSSGDPLDPGTDNNAALGCACSVPGKAPAHGLRGFWLVAALGALAGLRRRALR
jgi:MYXO-CTERM domain-containing protein